VNRALAARPRPLAETDDRALFDCGRESMNGWFRRHAWFNQLNDLSRISVIADVSTGGIIGYVTLSASQIERAFLPKSQQRNRPDPVPALLLGQLAVDRNYQGQGHAVDLMQHAFRAALHISELVGSAGVITHPLDDRVRDFYRQWGFEDLAFDPRRAMMVRMADIRQHFAGQGRGPDGD
jgi:GNAT superfamily N-acetyltransferase